MSWQCYMVEFVAGDQFRLAGDRLDWPGGARSVGAVMSFRDLLPGAMWFDEGELCVKLPGGGSEWNVDRGRIYNAQKPSRNLPAWARTGEPPNVTASPSINAIGTYHGWLRNGVLTDDCDGRKLDQVGRPIP